MSTLEVPTEIKQNPIQPNVILESVQSIPIKDMLIDEHENCRGKIPLHTLTSLAQNIDQHGLQFPILVSMPSDIEEPALSAKGYKYFLVSGFRRTLAFKILDRTEIPAIVRYIPPMQRIFINLMENLEREDLNMLQEANTIGRLMRMGMPMHKIIAELKRPKNWIRARVQLLRLDPELQEIAALGLLTPQNILDLSAIKDKDERFAAAAYIRDKREKGFTGAIPIKLKRPVTEEKKREKAIKKSHRTRPEILNFIDYLVWKKIPVGLHSRCLAWCAGEISDQDILTDMSIFAREQGLAYEVPNYGIPEMDDPLLGMND